MKNSKAMMKRLAAALLAGACVSGCVAVPYDAPVYGPGPYGQQQGYVGPVYRPPVVVAPSIGFEFGFGGPGYYNSRGYYGGHGHW